MLLAFCEIRIVNELKFKLEVGWFCLNDDENARDFAH
jgi:hypothetical protein